MKYISLYLWYTTLW